MEGEGWYDADEFAPAEKTVNVGEGFVTVNDFGDGATISFAGQVPTGATEFPIGANVTVAGNCTPVPVDIQAIVVQADGIADGQVQIQTLTAGGATDRTFLWIPTSAAGDYDMEGEGWYDADEFAPAEKTVAAGEGFVLVNDFGEASLKLPSPIE